MTHDTPSEISDLDPTFVFDFETYDDLGDGQRWSTWLDVEPLCRGPQPRPDWVVTSQAAVDTELGILKTGKEADAFLVERAVPGSDAPGESVVMVAKRYRSNEHRTFHRAASYTEGRSVKRSRDERALKRKSTWGKIVASSEWAISEWDALKRCWALGLPVPYPVQIDGVELLMEWITDDEGESAPRLAQTRPEPALLASYFDQLREALVTLVGNGLVHGDLSAYNILAAGERLVIIDLPQVVDLAGNAAGLDFLLRDCTNVCTWFRSRGLEVDGDELFAELLAYAF
ncbi:serine/threonine protein kinase [Nocardioides sp. Root1257]|uniref:serine protein kinase RIO n=1 Tax=unclassified Nocardioides TaxID=2615069 RepID=UPI0006FFA3FB|nr:MULTISPECIES: RIO1 family regulatory kinase/ATPase [unclassified Nocardioides]KQW53521.1 serine/threonine protein kinase [Nocardioides sp. Root1257]KRC56207.1 serine/threonine protein kinase [Nocardioides sp. Root224]